MTVRERHREPRERIYQMKRSLFIPILTILTGVSVALLLTAAAPSNKKDLSGAEMFRVYCASCHGEDGKGAGPAAAGLKVAPPDLTLIRARNKGEFPAFRITHIIDGYEVKFAHGSPDMPVWGDYFRDKQRDEATIALREHNLTEYIRSIQR